MRKITVLGLLAMILTSAGFSQDCKVLVNALSLNYTGDCKDNKANGHGKAVGQDSYEGEFKAGYPEGTGKYTWKVGDWFEGAWKKGLKEGQGTMHYKRDGNADSVITGFWKKDIYQGRFEKPFKILSQTSRVSSAKVTRNVGYKEHDITIVITNTSGGAATIGSKEATADATSNPKMKLSSIDVQKGNIGSQLDVDNSARSTKTLLRTVEFPFKAIFRIDSESVEIEFFEEGNYLIEINILN
ncbi:MAG: hypothetical protein V4450_09255 [Bacteroidota bacterium]